MSSHPKGTTNSSFSQVLPTLQLGVDSTSLGEFKTCPRRYQLTIVEGWQKRETPVDLKFGLHLHRARETYDHCRAAGADHDEALDVALVEALRDTWNTVLGRPWISSSPEKNRNSLLRSIVWYLDQFGRDDPIETVRLANGKAAVELSFRFDSGYRTSTGETILLCGHIDRIGRLGDQLYDVDIKTTKNALGPGFFSSFSPDNQMSLYSLACKVAFQQEVAGVIIDGLQIGATFTRCQRQLVPRRPDQLDEWLDDLGHWLRQMEICAERGHWPMNDKACGLYGGCQFRALCAMPPGQRAKFLAVDFHQHVWDPLQAR